MDEDPPTWLMILFLLLIAIGAVLNVATLDEPKPPNDDHQDDFFLPDM